MLYDPYLQNGLSDKHGKNGGLSQDLMMFSLAYSSQTGGAPGLGSFNPVLGAMALGELARELSLSQLRDLIITPIRRLVARLGLTGGSDRLDKRLGLALPLSDQAYSEMMEEVRRYKWLEAERAGRDIWKERAKAEDPEAVAFREWFRQYYGAWYLHRMTHKSRRRFAAAR
jgi:hypothetical protein